jgi:serine/threonine-protein kinase
VGKQKPDAQALIQDAGLRVTVHEADSKRPKDEVIAQSPSAGVQAPVNSRVTITVSKGVQKVAVPDVKGKTSSEASGILQGAGFKVTVVKQVGTFAQIDKVISQSPGSGTQSPKGSAVTITVGKKCTPKGTTPTPTPGKTPPPTCTG